MRSNEAHAWQQPEPTGSNRYTLNAQTGDRFTETAETDGFSTTYMGSYGRNGPRELDSAVSEILHGIQAAKLRLA